MAEDDDLVAEVAREALIAAGHGVGVLGNGADAFAVISARRPDLVILDCNMPGLSGLLVLRKIRDSAVLFDTPVMVLTGRQSERDADLAYQEGADDYMRKPFDPDELVFRVEELLAKRAAARPAQTARGR